MDTHINKGHHRSRTRSRSRARDRHSEYHNYRSRLTSRDRNRSSRHSPRERSQSPATRRKCYSKQSRSRSQRRHSRSRSFSRPGKSYKLVDTSTRERSRSRSQRRHTISRSRSQMSTSSSYQNSVLSRLSFTPSPNRDIIKIASAEADQKHDNSKSNVADSKSYKRVKDMATDQKKKYAESVKSKKGPCNKAVTRSKHNKKVQEVAREDRGQLDLKSVQPKIGKPKKDWPRVGLKNE